MRKFTFLIVALNMIAGQEIFESFDLDRNHRFVGTTTYEFSLDLTVIPYSLTMTNVNGDVSVNGKPGNDARIIEKIFIRSVDRKKAHSDYENFRASVTHAERSGKIEIIGHSSWASKIEYAYEITVPQGFNIKVKTGGGDINLTNILGEIELKTSGGDLNIASVTGKLLGRTSGGDIDLNRGEGILSLITSGGDVQTQDVEGKLDIHTSGGDIEVDRAEGDVSVNTSGGSIVLQNIEGSYVQGITSGGDIDVEDIRANISLSTSGGDITIENVQGNVEATTSGGDIDVDYILGMVEISTSAGSINGESLFGAVIARTSAGDVTIEKIWDDRLKDHNISLSAHMGNIELILPDRFPATIDAQVKGKHTSGAIDSEYPLTIELKSDYVRGHTTIDEGTYYIKLRSSFGTIRIEKE